MRGLPFPQDAAFERETSHDYGTPASNLEDIPIDPALADPPIDPALQAFPVKLDSDQVRVCPYFSIRDATWCCGCGAHAPIDRVASRLPSLIHQPSDVHAHAYVYPSFRMTSLCLSPQTLPITFANTRKVLRAIHLLNLSHQSISLPSPRSISPLSLQRRRKKFAGSQIAAFVTGMIRRTRLASRRRWFLVTSVVEVVRRVR